MIEVNEEHQTGGCNLNALRRPNTVLCSLFELDNVSIVTKMDFQFLSRVKRCGGGHDSTLLCRQHGPRITPTFKLQTIHQNNPIQPTSTLGNITELKCLTIKYH